MAAKGENSRCLYKDGGSKIVTIDSDEESAAREDGWTNKPGKPETGEIPQLAKKQVTTEEKIPQLAKKKK